MLDSVSSKILVWYGDGVLDSVSSKILVWYGDDVLDSVSSKKNSMVW